MSEANKQCYGCGACAAICPVKAIYIEEKERGTIYYKIGEQCIHCRKCVNVCPINTNLFHSEKNMFYKAVTRNKDILKKSSSGGIAYEMAYMILQEGGVVYGSGWNVNDQLVEHMRIDNIEQLQQLQGSKYVQSRMKEQIYYDMCEDLKTRKVLIIGTPCQIAAVRKYAKDHPNLWCIDLICHGVPSARLFNDQLKLLVSDPVRSISFRNGLSFRLDIKSDSKTCSIEGLDNPYYSLFLHYASLREDCYSCKYARRTRVGDITLGDYVEEDTGFSCVVPNTYKGQELINKSKDIIEYTERDAKLLNENYAFNHATVKHSSTEKFTKLYHKHGLLYAYYMCFPIFTLKRYIRKILGEQRYTKILRIIKK